VGEGVDDGNEVSGRLREVLLLLGGDKGPELVDVDDRAVSRVSAGGMLYACQWGPEPSDSTWLNGSVRSSIHLDARLKNYHPARPEDHVELL